MFFKGHTRGSVNMRTKLPPRLLASTNLIATYNLDELTTCPSGHMRSSSRQSDLYKDGSSTPRSAVFAATNKKYIIYYNLIFDMKTSSDIKSLDVFISLCCLM